MRAREREGKGREGKRWLFIRTCGGNMISGEGGKGGRRKGGEGRKDRVSCFFVGARIAWDWKRNLKGFGEMGWMGRGGGQGKLIVGRRGFS